jgi:hypothetical protein
MNQQYLKGVYVNLRNAYGQNALPDEATFIQKMANPQYAEGVRSNLVQYYGTENVPNSSKWLEKIGSQQPQTAQKTAQPPAAQTTQKVELPPLSIARPELLPKQQAQFPLQGQQAETILGVKSTLPPVKQQVPRETVSQGVYPSEKKTQEILGMPVPKMEEMPKPKTYLEKEVQKSISGFEKQEKQPSIYPKIEAKPKLPTMGEVMSGLNTDEIISLGNKGIEDRVQMVNPKTEEEINYEKQTYLNNNPLAYEKEMNIYGARIKALKDKINPIELQLKQQYGDNFAQTITQDEFNADANLQEYFKIAQGMNQISQEAQGLINEPRFAEFKKMLADAEVSQQKKDELKKKFQQKGVLGKLADIGLGFLETTTPLRLLGPKTFTGTKLQDESDKFLARGLTWLSAVPKMLENIDPTNATAGYDIWDKWFDQANEFNREVQMTRPVASDVQRDIKQKYAIVNGYKVYLDEKNNPTDVRDNKGFFVDEKTQDGIIKKYDENPQQYKKQEDFSVATLGAKSVPTILDMSGLIALSAATGGGAATLVPGIAAQTYSDIYQDALRKGLKPEDANDLATITGLAYGMVGLLNPMESRIAQGTMGKTFNKLFGQGLTKSDVALINSGKLSVGDFAKKTFISAIKNTGAENIEEVVLEPLAQRAIQYAYNENAKQYGTGFDVNKPIIDSKEAIETAMITTMTSMLMSPMEVVSSMPEQRREALKRSLNMPEKYIEFKKQALDNGQITENEYNYDIATFNNVVAKYNASKDLVSEDLQDELSELLLKKYTLEKKIEQVNDDALNVQNKKLLTDVNVRLQKMVEGSYDKEKEEAIRKEERVKPEPIVSEGTGMIGKEASDVANKLIAGQDLTSGERDIYDSYKPEIDKIVEAAKTKPKAEVVAPEVALEVTPVVAEAEVAPTEVVAKEEVKTPIYEEEARKEEPVLEGVRDVGPEAEAEQVSPELRTEEEKAVEEKITEPTTTKKTKSSKDIFAQSVDLFYKSKDATSAKEKRKLAEERRTLMDENPTMKYIDDNIKKIYEQLEEKGLLQKKGDCP